MPNLQMLNLADVYAKADQATAMQQQATLRDLQTQQLLQQQRQDVSLSELAKRSFDSQTGEMDLNAMSRGAAELGAYKPAMEFQEKATEAKSKKQALTKEQANIMGQLADEKVVNDEQTYQRWLGQLNEFDTKAAQSFSQKFPNYSKEAEPLLRQIGQQGMTSYQRQALDVQRQSNRDRTAARENSGLKASDSNALRAAIAESANVPFTQDAFGNVTIGALDPEKNRKLDRAKELASQYFMNDPELRGNHLGAAARATREAFGTGPAAGVPGGQPGGRKQLSPVDQQSALRAWGNEGNREAVLARLRAGGYDESFLNAPSAPPAPGLPTRTVSPSSEKPLIRLGPQAKSGANEALKEQRAVRDRLQATQGKLQQLKQQLTSVPELRRQSIIAEMQSLGAELQQLMARDAQLTEQHGG